MAALLFTHTIFAINELLNTSHNGYFTPALSFFKLQA